MTHTGWGSMQRLEGLHRCQSMVEGLPRRYRALGSISAPEGRYQCKLGLEEQPGKAPQSHSAGQDREGPQGPVGRVCSKSGLEAASS